MKHYTRSIWELKNGKERIHIKNEPDMLWLLNNQNRPIDPVNDKEIEVSLVDYQSGTGVILEQVFKIKYSEIGMYVIKVNYNTKPNSPTLSQLESELPNYAWQCLFRSRNN